MIQPILIDYDLSKIQSIPSSTRYLQTVEKLNEIIEALNGIDARLRALESKG